MIQNKTKNKTIDSKYIIKELTIEDNKLLYNSIINYVDIYIVNNRLSIRNKDNIINDKIIDIRYNLEFILNKLKTKEIDIEIIPWLESYKIDDTNWIFYIEKIKKNNDTKEKMSTINVFRCKKCGENKCTSHQIQTRSIDEPMTTFINCKICGNSWKF